MPTPAQLVAWSRDHATLLEDDLRLHPAQGGFPEYWEATNSQLKGQVQARAIAALDFLDRYASHSQWAARSRDVFEDHGETMETRARSLSDILRAWANAVETGTVLIPQAEAEGARSVVSTDLMDQVRKLLEDKTVHPAAPIVLAGAALEVALRSAVDELGLPLPERPSISSYAGLLRTQGLLSAQDVKDVTQMGGVRNSAAHGAFNDLSRERAGLMEQQVNMFLRRLADLLAPTEAVDSSAFD